MKIANINSNINFKGFMVTTGTQNKELLAKMEQSKEPFEVVDFYNSDNSMQKLYATGEEDIKSLKKYKHDWTKHFSYLKDRPALDLDTLQKEGHIFQNGELIKYLKERLFSFEAKSVLISLNNGHSLTEFIDTMTPIFRNTR